MKSTQTLNISDSKINLKIKKILTFDRYLAFFLIINSLFGLGLLSYLIPKNIFNINVFIQTYILNTEQIGTSLANIIMNILFIIIIILIYTQIKYIYLYIIEIQTLNKDIQEKVLFKIKDNHLEHVLIICLVSIFSLITSLIATTDFRYSDNVNVGSPVEYLNNITYTDEKIDIGGRFVEGGVLAGENIYNGIINFKITYTRSGSVYETYNIMRKELFNAGIVKNKDLYSLISNDKSIKNADGSITFKLTNGEIVITGVDKVKVYKDITLKTRN